MDPRLLQQLMQRNKGQQPGAGMGGGEPVVNARGFYSRKNATKPGPDPVRSLLEPGAKHGFNLTALQTLLMKPPMKDVDFCYFNEVLGHPRWSNADKFQAVKLGLEFGFDPNKGNGFPMQTPLDRALRIGDESLVKALLEGGANSSTRNSNGESILAVAVQSGNTNLIRMVAGYSDVKKLTGPDGVTRADSLGHSLSDLVLARTKIEKATHPDRAFDEMYNTLAVLKQHDLPQKELDGLRDKIKADLSWKENEKELLNSMLDTVKKVEPLPPYSRIHPVQVRPTNANVRMDDFSTAENTGGLWHPWLNVIFGKSTLQNDRDLSALQMKAFFTDAKDGMNDRWLKNLVKAKNYKDGMTGEKVLIDYVSDKNNPNGDTLFLLALRTKQYHAVDTLLSMSPNLHATDIHGNNALHLLAENAGNNTQEFLSVASKVLGIPEKQADGSIKRIAVAGYEGELPDLSIVNEDGKTFLDILKEKNPTLADELEALYGIVDPEEKVPAQQLPEWSVEKVKDAGGPQLYTPVLEYINPFMGAEIPAPIALLASASPSERGVHVDHTVYALEQIQERILKNQSPSDVQYSKEMFERYIQGADPETKVAMLMSFVGDMNMSPAKKAAYVGLLSHVTQTMRHGSPEEKAAIFDVFEQSSEDAKMNLLNVVNQQAILEDGSSKELQGLAQQLYTSLEKEISKKYGAPGQDSDASLGSGPKPDKP